jgi:hypothetical protein
MSAKNEKEYNRRTKLMNEYRKLLTVLLCDDVRHLDFIVEAVRKRLSELDESLCGE